MLRGCFVGRLAGSAVSGHYGRPTLSQPQRSDRGREAHRGSRPDPANSRGGRHANNGVRGAGRVHLPGELLHVGVQRDSL